MELKPYDCWCGAGTLPAAVAATCYSRRSRRRPGSQSSRTWPQRLRYGKSWSGAARGAEPTVETHT
eukprot:355769-Pyramimonas_sp.AAC.1